MTNIKCPVCREKAFPIGDAISYQLYKCGSCGNEFHVRTHYIETSIPLESKVYKALLNVSDPKMSRKLQMKAKKAFAGMSNFYPTDLDRQILEGSNVWDFGFYSSEEMEKIKFKATELDLIIEFIPS